MHLVPILKPVDCFVQCAVVVVVVVDVDIGDDDDDDNTCNDALVYENLGRMPSPAPAINMAAILQAVAMVPAAATLIEAPHAPFLFYAVRLQRSSLLRVSTNGQLNLRNSGGNVQRACKALLQ